MTESSRYRLQARNMLLVIGFIGDGRKEMRSKVGPRLAIYHIIEASVLYLKFLRKNNHL